MHPDASTDYDSSFSYNETASQPTTTFTDERGFDTTYKYENRAYTSRVTQVTVECHPFSGQWSHWDHE